MTDREEREKVIEILQKEKKTALHDNKWAFDYAIASIRTDLKYDLLYEETSGQADKPTTKNNLEVDLPDNNVGKIDDCISRQAVMNKILKFSVTDGRSVSVISLWTEVNELPSVTPQEPKTGHWIAHEVRLPDRTILNYRCSVCGRKLIGYSTETLSEAPYCHCGARMVEPQESEE